MTNQLLGLWYEASPSFCKSKRWGNHCGEENNLKATTAGRRMHATLFLPPSQKRKATLTRTISLAVRNIPIIRRRRRSPITLLLFFMANARIAMGVEERCRTTFTELQRKKAHRYIVFKIDEKKKEVVVEKVGGLSDSFDDFAASLPQADCRYAVYDFDFVTPDQCQKSKIFFIAWSPDISRIRTKFLYATSKEKFRSELDGVHYEMQASDPTELGIDALKERAS